MQVHKLVLYGAGNRCRKLCKMLTRSDIEVVAVVDSNADLWDKEIEGYCITTPEVLKKFRDICFCITPEDDRIITEIREKLQKDYHFKLENEISYRRAMLHAYVHTFADSQMFRQRTISNELESSGGFNIIFDCYKGLGLGGVEAWTTDLCQALIKEGKRNIFIISDIGDYKIPPALENCILYTDIEHTKRFAEKSIYNIMETILRKLPCKVVTCITDEVMLAAYIIKCYYPNMVEIISVIHNSIGWLYNEYMDFRDCSDFYVSVSQDIRNDLIERGLNPKQIKATTCPFPCELNLVRSYSQENYEPLRIGYAGRIEYHQKRMDLIMKLIAELEEKKVNYIVEFAGVGSALDGMKKFVHENQLEERVRFLGRLERSDISLFWRRQDICINLADYEGRSISILEAMANGVVPIVTRTSGVAEDIEDGVCGYIIPVEDYNMAAERIVYLENHRERLQEMGSRAHDVVYPKSGMEPHLAFWMKVLFGRDEGEGNGEK